MAKDDKKNMSAFFNIYFKNFISSKILYPLEKIFQNLDAKFFMSRFLQKN